ncbi:hypothetical protein AC96_1160 [Escherichia coli 2-156-04_S4_C2]|nr:hypothetical protein AC96_3208 [Escherichia coli 2-156-04_S4_C2]KDX35190.1 hypothetical protein AC96_1381 [Escherichia coli 2-156-04_S4_C2]KDX36129.1 hypothetical protein AC96_1160 [Escherichia coli 2-156-04_S4_C2]
MLQIGCHSLEVGRSSLIHKRSGCFNLLRGICTAAQHERRAKSPEGELRSS